MKTAILITSCLLWLWFLGCVISWRFGKVLLVEGTGFKSLEFAVLVLFTLGVGAYGLWPTVGVWILLAELVLWLVVQFFCHEYFTLFGVSESKLSGYNQCFKGTLRLFPESSTRLIPDLYHIVLHLLLAADLILVICTLV